MSKKKLTELKIRANGKESVLFRLKKSGDGSIVLIPHPSLNRRGFRATQHPSGIANVRTSDRKVNMYDVKRTDLWKQELFDSKLKERTVQITERPLTAVIIFKSKWTHSASNSKIFDNDRFLRNKPYGDSAILFSHLRHNRLNRLERYIKRGEVVVVTTPTGTECFLLSVNPLIGIRIDNQPLESLLANQPVIDVFRRAFDNEKK